MMEKIKWYKEVLELEPNSKVFFPLARLLVEDGQDTEAVVVLENGLQRHSEYLEARLFLIEILYKNRQKDLCSAQVKKLSDIFASYAGFWQAWAACLADEGDDADTASILRFIAARFITGPLQLHDVLNRGLASLIHDHQKEVAPSQAEECRQSVQPAPDVAVDTPPRDGEAPATGTEAVPPQSEPADMPENKNQEAGFLAETVASGQDEENGVPAPMAAQPYMDTELPANETVTEKNIQPLASQAVSGSEELEATGQDLGEERLLTEEASPLANAESETHKETATVSPENGEQPEVGTIAGEMQETDASIAQLSNDAANMAVEFIEADPSDAQAVENIAGEQSQSAYMEATAEQTIASEPPVEGTAHEEVPDTGTAEACQPPEDAASEMEVVESIQAAGPAAPMPETTVANPENITLTEKMLDPAANDAGEHPGYIPKTMDAAAPEALPVSGDAAISDEPLTLLPLATADPEDQPGAVVEEAVTEKIVADAPREAETTEQPRTEKVSDEASEEEAIQAGIEELQLPHQEEGQEVKKAEILDPALTLLVQNNDLDENEECAAEEDAPAANKESAAAMVRKNAGGEEPFSLRTRSMAEVLAEQGDTQGALDIYQELAASASEPGEAEDIRQRMTTLRARLGEPEDTIPPQPEDDSGKERLIGMLETLARRVEARVNS